MKLLLIYLIILFSFLIYRKKVIRRVKKLNPLKNTRAMLKLNPYAAVTKRVAILTAGQRLLAREAVLAEKSGVSIKSCIE